MESSIAVELAKDMGKCDAVVNVIMMDDDTTTIGRLKGEYKPAITKWSDLNHA